MSGRQPNFRPGLSLVIFTSVVLAAPLAIPGSAYARQAALNGSSKTASPVVEQSGLCATRHVTTALYGRLPLVFEQNAGQANSRAQFVAHGGGYSLFLDADRAVLALMRRPASDRPGMGFKATPSGSSSAAGQTPADLVEFRIRGASRRAVARGEQLEPGKSNYLIGRDSRRWIQNVAEYARVRCTSVYPGIDLTYYGNQAQLEHDFIVAPGANPARIDLSIKDTRKAGQTGALRIAANGDLVVPAGPTDVLLRRPIIYQVANGSRETVAGGYVLRGPNRVGFRVAAYDHHRPLVIDPILSYSTYYGGSNDDVGTAIAVDASGNAYVAGYTLSPDLPPFPTAFQPALSEIPATSSTGTATLTEDAFVVKIDPTSSAILYATYLGGAGDDRATGIAVDPSGAVVVVGTTTSTSLATGQQLFPTTAASFQPTPGGGTDAFICKLDPTGSVLQYGSFLGGPGDDEASAVTLDSSGNAYVVGTTSSGGVAGITAPGSGFPLVRAVQSTNAGNLDGFLTEVDPTGASLLTSTFLGGSGEDHATGVAIDSTGNAYVAGWTASLDFPVTAAALQPSLHTTPANPTSGLNAFVTKINLDPALLNAGLIYSTYLGGACEDYATGIGVDAGGNAVVVGQTCSSPSVLPPTRPVNLPTGTGFPLVNSMGSALGGQWDGFVAKLNSAGSWLIYSTYLGGSGYDDCRGVAVDALGNAYVAGQTASLDFPVTADAIEASLHATVNSPGESATGSDGYLTVISPTGTLAYSTYLGGSDVDACNAVAFDAVGGVYLTGLTRSADFPLLSPVQSALSGSATAAASLDAFITKIAVPPTAPSGLDATAISSTQIALTWTANSAVATSYEIDRKGIGGTFQPIHTIPATSTTYTDPGLPPNTLYTYEVRAINSSSNVDSGLSNAASAMTLPTAATPPSAPTGLSGVTVSGTEIDLSWKVGANQAAFLIWRRVGSTGSFAQLDTVGPAVTTYADTTVTPNNTYFYFVTGANAIGNSSPSNTVAVSSLPSAPVAPSGLSATASSDSQIRLVWIDNSNNETGFKIERQTANGAFSQIIVVPAGSTTFTDTGLSPNSTYTYRVRATNGGGDSPYSNTASATTQSNTIAGVVTSSYGGSTSPVIGVTVSLIQNGNTINQTTSDTTGNYAFTGLLDGQYTVQVTAPGQTGTPSLSVSANYSATNGLTTANVSIAPLAVMPAGVNMVSVPYDYSSTSLDAAAMLGITTDPKGQIDIATYDPASNTYLLYPVLPGSNGTQMIPGRGYWIKETAAQPLLAAGIVPSSPFVSVLSSGWNMIGDPFTTPVSFSNLQFNLPIAVGATAANAPMSFTTAVAGQVIGPSVWMYSASAGQYIAATTLQPFVGYWMYVGQGALNNNVTVTFTNPGP